MHLRTLLSVTFAAITLAVVLCGSYGARVLSGRLVEQRIGGEMATAAGQVRNVLDRSVYNRWRDVKILAIVAGTTAKTPEARRPWLESMKRTFPNYAWIGFADPDGTVTASTDRLLEGKSVAERPWFKAGRQAQYAGDLHEAALLASKLPAPPDGEPWRFVDLSAPIRDESGHLEGVVGAHLSWAWARELTQSVMAPAAGQASGIEVLVIDSSGIVILGPPSLQGKPMPRESNVWQTARAGEAFALETWPDGERYLVGASKTVGLNEYQGLGWTVLVRQNASVALAPAVGLERELLLGGVLLSMVAAGLGWVTAWWISRPVLALANAAEWLGRVPGVAPPVFRSAGIEEVRRLSSALTGMFQAVSTRDQSLAEANLKLEERVELRTRELQAARLAAESASRAKTRFLAGVSHELRTPLNGILGYAALLQEEGGLNDRQRQRTDAMMTAGRHLLDMINRVLQLSEIEAENTNLQLASVEVRPLLRACLDVVRPTAQVKRLSLDSQFDPGAPTHVMADPTRLRQILLNLLGNAVKFTDRGSITLRLRATDEEERLRIAISDTGRGVPPDVQNRLFQDFERLDPDAHAIEGAGLGLALSARMAAAMGGTMGFEENDEAGSTFWVELACVTDPVSEGLPRSPNAPATNVGRSSRPLRILVADDTAMNRDIAEAFLSAGGHDVVLVENGQAAIDRAATEAFDAILMDVRMPGMDGLEATRRIRKLSAPFGQVPIVALTAQAFAEQVAECRRAGMDAHVSKPFDKDGLLAAVANVARRDEGAAAEPDAGAAEPLLDQSRFDQTALQLAPETLQVHLATIAKRCDALQNRLRQTDPENRIDTDLLDAAHTLAGSAGLFGFARLSGAASRFEYAMDARADEAPTRRQELAAAIDATLRELDKLASLSADSKQLAAATPA